MPAFEDSTKRSVSNPSINQSKFI